MNWYFIHPELRREKRARQNFEQQAYVCIFPILPAKKLCRINLALVDNLTDRSQPVRLVSDNKFPPTSKQVLSVVLRYVDRAKRTADLILSYP